MEFSRFTGAFRGRLISSGDPDVKLLSEDLFTEFVFRIGDDCRFFFGEPRDSSDEAVVFESTVVILLPDMSPDDMIAITKIRD